jgi:hypothetical protein
MAMKLWIVLFSLLVLGGCRITDNLNGIKDRGWELINPPERMGVEHGNGREDGRTIEGDPQGSVAFQINKTDAIFNKENAQGEITLHGLDRTSGEEFEIEAIFDGESVKGIKANFYSQISSKYLYMDVKDPQSLKGLIDIRTGGFIPLETPPALYGMGNIISMSQFGGTIHYIAEDRKSFIRYNINQRKVIERVELVDQSKSIEPFFLKLQGQDIFNFNNKYMIDMDQYGESTRKFLELTALSLFPGRYVYSTWDGRSTLALLDHDLSLITKNYEAASPGVPYRPSETMFTFLRSDGQYGLRLTGNNNISLSRIKYSETSVDFEEESFWSRELDHSVDEIIPCTTNVMSDSNEYTFLSRDLAQNKKFLTKVTLNSGLYRSIDLFNIEGAEEILEKIWADRRCSFSDKTIAYWGSPDALARSSQVELIYLRTGQTQVIDFPSNSLFHFDFIGDDSAMAIEVLDEQSDLVSINLIKLDELAGAPVKNKIADISDFFQKLSEGNIAGEIGPIVITK